MTSIVIYKFGGVCLIEAIGPKIKFRLSRSVACLSLVITL